MRGTTSMKPVLFARNSAFWIIAAMMLPSSAAAQNNAVMYLDSAEACEMTQEVPAEERETVAMHDAGAMLLDTTGMWAIEYYCEFESPIVFDWSETSTQIRAGYCAEPGEYIYPKVFVFGMSEYEPDVVQVWASDEPSGEATRYSACQ